MLDLHARTCRQPQDEPVQGNVPRGQCTASNTTFAKRRHVVVQRQKRSRLVLPAHVPVLQKTTNTTNTTTNNNAKMPNEKVTKEKMAIAMHTIT